MGKVSVSQIHELGLQIRRGQVEPWKVRAVFGIEAYTLLDMYLRLMELAKVESISAEQMQALMEGNDKALGIYKVTVDYGLTLEQMIAVGRYNWVDGDITFPIQGESKVERELTLVHLNKVVTTDKILAELAYRGLRPAKIEELLALGATHPDLQKEFPIVALGSSCVGDCCIEVFVYLDRDGMSRGLGLNNGMDDWGERCRFVAVRKDAA